MTDYTPSAGDLELAYVNHRSLCLSESMRDAGEEGAARIVGSDAEEEFRRAIAKIKADALRGFASDLSALLGPGQVIDGGRVLHMIVDEARKIEREAGVS